MSAKWCAPVPGPFPSADALPSVVVLYINRARPEGATLNTQCYALEIQGRARVRTNPVRVHSATQASAALNIKVR